MNLIATFQSWPVGLQVTLLLLGSNATAAIFLDNNCRFVLWRCRSDFINIPSVGKHTRCQLLLCFFVNSH